MKLARIFVGARRKRWAHPPRRRWKVYRDRLAHRIISEVIKENPRR